MNPLPERSRPMPRLICRWCEAVLTEDIGGLYRDVQGETHCPTRRVVLAHKPLDPPAHSEAIAS